MRKSRKQRRTKRIHLKKHRKSRKFSGGNSDMSGYVLAGFKDGQGVSDMPIFLLNEKSLKNRLPGKIAGSDGFTKKIIVPVLYNLNYRGINLMQLRGAEFFPVNITFYDTNEELLFSTSEARFQLVGTGPTAHWVPTFERKNEEKMRTIELKYPGLFTRIYVTEEEERNALEQLQRKHQQTAEKQEPQMQSPSLSSELSDEEKEKIYQMEIENTSQMIPYLKKELKQKKKEKLEKKRYYDNLMINDK